MDSSLICLKVAWILFLFWPCFAVATLIPAVTIEIDDNCMANKRLSWVLITLWSVFTSLKWTSKTFSNSIQPYPSKKGKITPKWVFKVIVGTLALGDPSETLSELKNCRMPVINSLIHLCQRSLNCGDLGSRLENGLQDKQWRFPSAPFAVH